MAMFCVQSVGAVSSCLATVQLVFLVAWNHVFLVLCNTFLVLEQAPLPSWCVSVIQTEELLKLTGHQRLRFVVKFLQEHSLHTNAQAPDLASILWTRLLCRLALGALYPHSLHPGVSAGRWAQVSCFPRGLGRGPCRQRRAWSRAGVDSTAKQPPELRLGEGRADFFGAELLS